MNHLFKTISFIVFAGALVGGGIWYSRKVDRDAQKATEASQASAIHAVKQLMDQLKIEDVVTGTGEEAKAGESVTVQYTGTFEDGKKFDSSYDHGQPFTFLLGGGQVIKGWDLGVQGMKVGGTRKLTIPSELAYGAQGAGGVIPPNATLHFTLELVGIKK